MPHRCYHQGQMTTSYRVWGGVVFGSLNPSPVHVYRATLLQTTQNRGLRILCMCAAICKGILTQHPRVEIPVAKALFWPGPGSALLELWVAAHPPRLRICAPVLQMPGQLRFPCCAPRCLVRCDVCCIRLEGGGGRGWLHPGPVCQSN